MFLHAGQLRNHLNVNRPDFILSKVKNSLVESISRNMYILTSHIAWLQSRKMPMRFWFSFLATRILI